MRHVLLIIFCLLSAVCLPAQEVKPAWIHGTIKDFKGGSVSMIYNEPYRIEPVKVESDGTFDYREVIEHPEKASLFFEDYKCTVELFMENDMEAMLDISFVPRDYEGLVVYDAVVDYRGDNADCTEYMKRYMDWSLYKSLWPFERLDTLSFAEYREGYLEEVDAQKVQLMQVKSLAFRRAMSMVLDEAVPGNLFRFAWCGPREDADFECWVESFDRNDLENVDMAEYYLRWYLINHPAKENEDWDIHYLQTLKTVFSNQDVINVFADNHIVGYLEQAPDNMEAVLAQYKTVSTNEWGHHVADSVYKHYKGLTQGSPAMDFEMTDREGKTFRLSDFKGKAVYIDVWATWCGPCCAEIPHMEKLAAHYAQNDEIELISISIDEDKAKWEKKLEEDKPEWKQFICLDALDSQLCKNYSINAIPRFLFFDRSGRVISLNAPLPSAENIIEYIDKHLAD